MHATSAILRGLQAARLELSRSDARESVLLLGVLHQESCRLTEEGLCLSRGLGNSSIVLQCLLRQELMKHLILS